MFYVIFNCILRNRINDFVPLWTRICTANIAHSSLCVYFFFVFGCFYISRVKRDVTIIVDLLNAPCTYIILFSDRLLFFEETEAYGKPIEIMSTDTKKKKKMHCYRRRVKNTAARHYSLECNISVHTILLILKVMMNRWKKFLSGVRFTQMTI